MRGEIIGITPVEWADVVELVERLWPGTKTWRTADELYSEFALYDAASIRAAVGDLFDEGRQSAPSPSKVKSATVTRAAAKGVHYEGPHQHVLGELPPTTIYGSVFAHEMGPGEIRCVTKVDPDTWCDYQRACHCADCRADPRYAPERMPIKIPDVPGS